MALKIDEETDAGRNDQQPDHLGGREKIGQHLRIVAAQQFIQETEDAVERQITGHRDAALRMTHQIKIEEKEQKLLPRLIKLDRVQTFAGIAERGIAAFRIGDSPEEIGRLSPAAAVQEAADPPAGVGDGHGRRVHVQHTDDVELAAAAVEPERGQRQQEAAVENESALIHPEDAPEVVAVLLEILHDIENARADDSGDHGDKERGGCLIRTHPGVFSVHIDQPAAEDETECGHRPIAADRKAAE